MPRQLTLRQIEAFKAVIENGTISRAAESLNISQPAMSKLVANLEFDSGLRLFDRVKRRLAPTANAMRLYEEVRRLFSGVRGVQSAVEAIRREEQGRLAIGVLPALANQFIQHATTAFLKSRRNVFCSVQSLSSQWVVDWVIARKLDVGLVSARTDNPYVLLEPLMEQALVCIMPPDHPLAAKRVIEPQDLHRIDFVGFDSDLFIAHLVTDTLSRYKVSPQTVLVSNVALTIAEFVAAGHGVSLVHPLMISGLESRLAMRRFEPEIRYNFQLCWSADSRNAHIVDSFIDELRENAKSISHSLLAAV
jgi:DNA-binding transcriptional LysR family regulator